MQERDVQARFSRWIREYHREPGAWELKLTKGFGRALPFSAFQPQQLPCLERAKHGCVYKKLSDADPGIKPFDAFQLCNVPAFVVACWYEPRKKVEVCWIDIDVFLEEIKNSNRKSITLERALALAHKAHTL